LRLLPYATGHIGDLCHLPVVLQIVEVEHPVDIAFAAYAVTVARYLQQLKRRTLLVVADPTEGDRRVSRAVSGCPLCK
jgi:hypothetical protein